MIKARGQIFTIDLLAAFFIFLILLTFLFYAWNENIAVSFDLRKKARLKHDAILVLNNLTLTPGYPSAWENDQSLLYPGLASSRHKLDADKLSAFANYDYNSMKSILRLEEYDFYLSVTQDANTVFDFGEKILAPSYAVGLERVVKYNGEPAKIRFEVYAE